MITIWPTLAKSQNWPLMWTLFFLFWLLPLFSFTSYSTKTNKIMLKKTWKGHHKEVNLLGPIIPGQIIFAFCFGVCVCFQRPTQMLFDKFWDPWYWKVCLLIQGQRTKETGLSQFRSSPPPSCHLTLMRRLLALKPTDIWKHRCSPEPWQDWARGSCNKPKPEGETPLTVWAGGWICHCLAGWLKRLSGTSADTGCLNRGSVKRAFVTETSPNSYFTVTRGTEAETGMVHGG